MKKSIRLIALTFFLSISLQLNAQKNEKVIVYKKNGDILTGTVEYVSEPDKIRIHIARGTSFLINRDDIDRMENLTTVKVNKNKFYGNVQMGTMIRFVRESEFMGIPFNLNFSSGYRINENASIGLASGLVLINNAYLQMGAEFQYDFNPRINSSKAHYFRLRSGFPLMISAAETYTDYYVYDYNGGYYYDTQTSEITNKRGFFINPEFGVKFNGLANESFYMGIGYFFQTDKFDYKNYYNQNATQTQYANRLTLNFGYFF